MAKLKMVAGKTYICPALFGAERTITRGEVVEVPEDKKAILLEDSYMDALNNTHHYFAEVEGGSAPADDEEDPNEGGPAAKPAKPAKRTRAA